ncbi:MAG: phosphoesterase [Acidobacteria bacterium]|nr:phosphoesterase [Acidobacteriota bacterium]
MTKADSRSLPTDLFAHTSAPSGSSPNGEELLSDDKATKKQGRRHSRRQFLGQAGGATAGVLAVSAIGLEPLIGSRRSAALAVEVSPFVNDRNDRANDAEQIRNQAAAAEEVLGQPAHPTNGDEELYPNRIGNFHKTLPHNSIGEVDPAAYNQFLAALASGTFTAFENVPRHPGGTGELANPLGGLAFNMEGPDSPAVITPPAFLPPPIASRKFAAQAVELYWQAYLRDVPFTDYETNPVVAQACADLTRFGADYIGPKVGGVVTPQVLFRYDFPGSTVGPMVSQFLYRTFFYDGIEVIPRMRVRQPVINWNPDGTFTFDPFGRDFLTAFSEWLNHQNGVALGNANVFDVNDTRRFIRNVRDIGHLASSDTIQTSYYRAALTGLGPADLGNPYTNSTRQGGFATFGLGHLNNLIGSVHKGERHTWYHKWFVHRYPRPDGGLGLVDNHLQSRANYPLHPDLLNSPVLPLIAGYNQHLNQVRFGSSEASFLLPLELPGGSPNHPSAPAGHAVTAGACVTILKAWFRENTVINNPVQPNRDGTALVPFTGAQLTVGGELNKLAHNMSAGRDMSGVHWRVADDLTGLFQGEAVAIRLLTEAKATYPEPNATFTLTKFDGTTITI